MSCCVRMTRRSPPHGVGRREPVVQARAGGPVPDRCRCRTFAAAAWLPRGLRADVHGGMAGFAHAEIHRVGGEADDRHWRLRAVHDHTPPDGIRAAEVHTREGFIDDGDSRHRLLRSPVAATDLQGGTPGLQASRFASSRNSPERPTPSRERPQATRLPGPSRTSASGCRKAAPIRRQWRTRSVGDPSELPQAVPIPRAAAAAGYRLTT